MNTISMNGQTMAMDGRQVYNAFSPQKGESKVPAKGTLPNSASEVLQNFEANKADLEASVQELQRLSDIVTGHKLHFNVNDELNRVVVTVVDASTNEIIREIPSKDIQKLQARMKQAIGVLFDEMI
ncbi:flagellar protein FlaG [Treponema sp.]|uniref:flagellar protein FlaG n=1 Tax=Treponema sp. TaxID=166 RepID=UPI003F07EDA2